MNNTNNKKQARNLTRDFFLTVSGIVLLLGLLFALMQITRVGASTPPKLDTDVLTEMAIAEAQEAGLQEAPAVQRAVQMSLGEWNSRINAELGKDAAQFGLTPDMPVFVLAIRGEVVWRAPGLSRPGQNTPERYNNITIVLDARTGDLIWRGSYRSGFQMPISVP